MKSVPSLVINEHDRFTPEMRDKVLDKLRKSMQAARAPAYQMLTPHRLHQLAQFEASEGSVISLYLQLTPDRRLNGGWHIVFKDLVAATLGSITDKRRREKLASELQCIEQTLQVELPSLGRGAAFFSCQARGFWLQLALSLPLADKLYLGSRPYIRPLARTRDEHDRFILALLSLDRSRFFFSQIGQLEEVIEVAGERSILKLEALRNQARVLASVTELVMAEFQGRHLLLSVAPELRAEYVDHLSKVAQRHLDGEFSVDIHAEPPTIAGVAEPVQRVIEEREEVATVRRLLDANPKYVAWGVPATLEALQERRVMVLVIDDALSARGGRCRACKALLPGDAAQCPYCDRAAVEAVDDVTELAIELGLEQKAGLEMVRSSPTRQSMAQRGAMGALLRW
jgi:hypothetical protein